MEVFNAQLRQALELLHCRQFNEHDTHTMVIAFRYEDAPHAIDGLPALYIPNDALQSKLLKKSRLLSLNPFISFGVKPSAIPGEAADAVVPLATVY